MADEQFDALGESGPDGWQEIERLRRGTSFIAITPRRVLNPPSATGMKFWSLNPYIGCEFGCSYCYARDTHRWTVERAADRRDAAPAAHDAAAMPPDESFERRILVKRGAAEKLLRTLHPDRLRGASLMIGTATDPYQPAERRFGVTRSLLEALLGFRELRLGIITKSPLIVRDAGLLVRLTEQHDVSISISIASVDAPLLRRLEPRTPTPAARLRALRRLAGAGLRCSALIAPILPGITDGRSALRAVVRAAHDAGARRVSGAPLRMGPATRRTFLPWLDRERPDLAARYRRHFGRRRNTTPAYQRALHDRLLALQREFDMVLRTSPTDDPADDERPAQVEMWECGAAVDPVIRITRSTRPLGDDST